MFQDKHHFGDGIRCIMFPELLAMGFVHDGQDDSPEPVLRRAVTFDAFDAIQIIDFQLGTESLDGHFTINLAVHSGQFNASEGIGPRETPETFDCLLDMTQRLGFLIDPPVGALKRLFGSKQRKPHDHWWKFSDRPGQVRRTLIKVKQGLLLKGVPWLDGMSRRDKFLGAMRQLQERKQQIDGLGPPRVIGPLFEPGEAITPKALKQKFHTALDELRKPES